MKRDYLLCTNWYTDTRFIKTNEWINAIPVRWKNVCRTVWCLTDLYGSSNFVWTWCAGCLMAQCWYRGRSTSIREGTVEIYDNKVLYIRCVEDCHNFKVGYLLLILYGAKLLVTNWERIKNSSGTRKLNFGFWRIKSVNKRPTFKALVMLLL